MTSTRKNFLIRSASALVAVAIVATSYIFLKTAGLKILVAFGVLIGTWELLTLLFNDESSNLLKAVFFVLSLLTCAVSSVALNAGALFLVIFVFFLTILSLLMLNKTGDLNRIVQFNSKATLGLIYIGLGPSFILRLLDTIQGHAWFVYLLAVVLSGDTFAYIFGVLWGKHKIMPSISPKKTWQGSIGGVLGSILGGFIVWFFMLKTFNLGFILGLAAVSGLVGQFGDFFESLLKRVSNVKDSGNIMPGHGGVLDRIDGILFAGPIVFLGVVTVSHLLS